MAVRLSSVIAILFGTLFLSTGQGLHQALIPISAEAFGFTSIAISVLASVYFAGYLGGCYFAPMLIKRVGYTKTLAITASALSALSMLHILAPSEQLWILARIAVGFCFANVDVVLEAWLADRAEKQDRGRLLSIYRLVDLFALGAGQFLIAHASPTEFILFAVVGILVSLSVIVVSLSVAPTPVAPDNVKVRFFKICRLVPLSSVAAFLQGVTSGIYWGFAPIFSAHVAKETGNVGMILAATLVGAALVQYPIGVASDRFERRRLLMVVSLFASVSAVIVAVVSFYYVDAIIIAMLAYGATSFCIYPVAMTYAFDRTEPKDFVEVGAVVLIAFGLGAAIGPLLTPLALHFGNYSGTFVLISVVYVLLFVFAWYRSRVSDVTPNDQKVEFVPVPSTTPVILEFDPRLDTVPSGDPDVAGTANTPSE